MGKRVISCVSSCNIITSVDLFFFFQIFFEYVLLLRILYYCLDARYGA